MWSQVSPAPASKLKTIKSDINLLSTSLRKGEMKEVLLRRSITDYCHLTHTCFFSRNPALFCDRYNVQQYVNLFLVECPKFASLKRRPDLLHTLPFILQNGGTTIKNFYNL